MAKKLRFAFKIIKHFLCTIRDACQGLFNEVRSRAIQNVHIFNKVSQLITLCFERSLNAYYV